MLEAIINIILYIPRKIYSHFANYNFLKKDNKKLEIMLINNQRLLKRIADECEYNMTKNTYGTYEGFKKIKRLAQTFDHNELI